METLIGLVGKKRSGKNTVADIIIDYHDFTVYSFAKPIKDAVKSIFDWNERHIEGDLKEVVDSRWGISPREAMQHLGTDWAQIDLPETFPEFKKVCGRRLWVKIFLEWYAKHKIIASASYYDRNIRVIITDVRFHHEVNVIKDLGGTIIKVERPNIDNADKHESEAYVDSIKPDFTFINNVSKDELKGSVLLYMKDLYDAKK